jgi:hypothetical protein
MAMKRYTFLITRELDADLKSLKKRDGTPEGEIIRRALRAWLRHQGIGAQTRRNTRKEGL